MKAKYLIALGATFLVILSTLHFFAYSFSQGQGGSGVSLDARLALLFILYYLSWMAFIVAVFYLLEKYIPIYGVRFLVILIFITATLWIPCAVIIDGFLVDQIYHREFRSVSEILTASESLDYYNKFLTFCFFFGVIAFIVYYRLYQDVRIQVLQQEKSSVEANFAMVEQRLISLQSQLAPHFLFNCLNMLSGLARTGQRDRLVFAVARLGDMLRFVSEASRRSTIFLSEEIEFVRTYVELQKVRFGEKYRFSMDIRGASADIECPPFCLHTLVENAYTHSAPTSGRDADISVQIDIDERSVDVKVRNSDPCTDESVNLGIALANLHDRLELLYGKDYELSSISDQTSYIATMRIRQ